MLDTIREIGIFMIAAQAVVHFAPGRQYEKYIKSVSGIIILLLFCSLFCVFRESCGRSRRRFWRNGES